MLRTTRAARRTALLAAVAALTLTACGSDGGGSRSSKKGGGTSADEQERKPKTLVLGQTADEPDEETTKKGTTKFDVAAKRVVLGKPGDLADASSDPEQFKGKIPAWLYVDYTHVGGASLEASTGTDWGITVAGGERGRPLLMLLGGLPSTPDDCREDTAVGVLKKGQTETLCQPFVIPEGKKVTEVLLNRGFHSEPTRWRVK